MSELYPGFTLKQFFNHDAIPILLHQSTTQQSIFSNGTVDFVYNAYGYRTHLMRTDTERMSLLTLIKIIF